MSCYFHEGSNGQITYGGVSEDGFIINPVTGAITTTKELDTELQDHYTLTGIKMYILRLTHLNCLENLQCF